MPSARPASRKFEGLGEINHRSSAELGGGIDKAVRARGDSRAIPSVWSAFALALAVFLNTLLTLIRSITANSSHYAQFAPCLTGGPQMASFIGSLTTQQIARAGPE